MKSPDERRRHPRRRGHNLHPTGQTHKHAIEVSNAQGMSWLRGVTCTQGSTREHLFLDLTADGGVGFVGVPLAGALLTPLLACAVGDVAGGRCNRSSCPAKQR